ncbi:MAG: TolC family protein, partial [Gammaproteobacteria bacterium]
MKIISGWLSLALLMVLAVPSAHAVDLAKVYEDALLADPTLKEAAANRMATLETKPQALSSLLPQVSGQYVYDKAYNDGNSTFQQVIFDDAGDPIGVQNVTTAFKESPDDERQFWQLRVDQTLFRWDQFIALKQADKRVAQAEVQYRAAQQDLMIRASQRYFDVLGARATLVAGEAARDSIGRQLEQAEKRFEVGLIAITDVQESQASYDSAVAGVIEAKRTMATAQEFLREITGEYYEDLADAGPTIPLIPPNPADVEVWVDTSRDRNLTL